MTLHYTVQEYIVKLEKNMRKRGSEGLKSQVPTQEMIKELEERVSEPDSGRFNVDISNWTNRDQAIQEGSFPEIVALDIIRRSFENSKWGENPIGRTSWYLNRRIHSVVSYQAKEKANARIELYQKLSKEWDRVLDRDELEAILRESNLNLQLRQQGIRKLRRMLALNEGKQNTHLFVDERIAARRADYRSIARGLIRRIGWKKDFIHVIPGRENDGSIKSILEVNEDFQPQRFTEFWDSHYVTKRRVTFNGDEQTELYFYPNGKIAVRQGFKDGKLHGTAELYGPLFERGLYGNDLDNEHTLTWKGNFDMGEAVSVYEHSAQAFAGMLGASDPMRCKLYAHFSLNPLVSEDGPMMKPEVIEKYMTPTRGRW